jgi:hypothetical protein
MMFRHLIIESACSPRLIMRGSTYGASLYGASILSTSGLRSIGKTYAASTAASPYGDLNGRKRQHRNPRVGTAIDSQEMHDVGL